MQVQTQKFTLRCARLQQIYQLISFRKPSKGSPRENDAKSTPNVGVRSWALLHCAMRREAGHTGAAIRMQLMHV